MAARISKKEKKKQSKTYSLSLFCSYYHYHPAKVCDKQSCENIGSRMRRRRLPKAIRKLHSTVCEHKRRLNQRDWNKFHGSITLFGVLSFTLPYAILTVHTQALLMANVIVALKIKIKCLQFDSSSSLFIVGTSINDVEGRKQKTFN